MAVEFRTLTAVNAADIAEWCDGVAVVEHDALEHEKTQPGINVPCKGRVLRASIGDTVRRNNDGTFDVIRTSRME